MRAPTINYARTRDGRLELGICPTQRRTPAPDPERLERGRFDWRRSYYDLLRQPTRGGGY